MTASLGEKFDHRNHPKAEHCPIFEKYAKYAKGGEEHFLWGQEKMPSVHFRKRLEAPVLLAQEGVRSTPPTSHLDSPNSLENTKNATFSKNVRKHFRCSKITLEHSWMLPDASGIHFEVSRDFLFSTIFRPKSGEHGNFKELPTSKNRISTI